MANELPIRFDNTFPKNLDPKLLDTILTFRPGVNKNGALSIKDLKAFLNSAGTFSTTFKAGPVGEYALIWESELGINQTYMFQLWYLGFTSDYFDANGQRPLIGRLDVAFAAKPTAAELDPNKIVLTHTDEHGEDGDFVLQDEGGVARLYVRKTAWNQRTQFNYIGALNTTDQENLVNGGTYGSLPGGAATSFESLLFTAGGSTQEGEFIRYDVVQQTSEEQKRNAAANVGAVKKFEDDTREGSLTQSNGGFTLNSGSITVNTEEDGSASDHALRVQNTVGGGLFLQRRGSLTVRAKGDSVTDYHILRLQDYVGPAAGPANTVWEVRAGGVTRGGAAVNGDDYVTKDQVDSLIGGDVSTKVDKTSIVDNLTTTDPTTVLSGNQGKVLKDYVDAINTILASDETDLDELQEIVNYIQLNREDLDTLSIPSIAGLQDALDAKLAITSVVDGLTSILTDAPLSANQGRVLKELIDTINNRLTSNEPSLNTLQEIVDLIKGHEETLLNLEIADVSGLQGALNNKVNVGSIVDHLTSPIANAPLSANQGRVLKDMLDAVDLVLSSDDPALDSLQKIVDRIKENGTDLSGLQDSINTLNDSIASINSSIDDIEFAILDTQNDVTNIQGDINSLESDVSGIQTDVSNVETSVSNLQSDVSVIETDISGLQSDVSGLQSSKVNISSIVDDLTSTLANVPLSANQGRVLKGLIDNINTILTSDDTDLDEIQELVNFIKQNKEDLDTLSISNIAGLVDALYEKVSGVGSENVIPKFDPTGKILGDSNILDNGTSVEISKPVSISGVAPKLTILATESNPEEGGELFIGESISLGFYIKYQGLSNRIYIGSNDGGSGVPDINVLRFDRGSPDAIFLGKVQAGSGGSVLNAGFFTPSGKNTVSDSGTLGTMYSLDGSDGWQFRGWRSGAYHTQIEFNVTNNKSIFYGGVNFPDIVNAVGEDILLRSSTGEITKRTLVEFLSDIGFSEKVSGTGSENVIPKFDSTGKILGDSSIYDIGGRIGIGTSTPSSTITVGEPEAGNLSGSNLERAITNYQNGGSYFMGMDKDQGLEFVVGTSNSGHAMVACMSGHPLFIRVGVGGGVQAVKVYPGGNVAIGHSLGEPNNKLDIDGNIRIRSINNATGEVVTVSPEGVITKRTLADLFNDLGITGPVVRDLIKNLVGEEKLDISDLKGQSVLDDTQYEVVDGKHTIKTDPVPTEDSEAFVTSGTVHTALQGTGVPNSVARQIPGYAPVFTKVSSPDSNSYREVIGLNGIVIASISNGDSDRIARSEDGINFYKVNVGFIDLWGVESSPHGTLIGVGRNAGPDNIIRSTDHGRTWNTITAPITRSLNRVIYHRGVWMCCARDGVGNRALYSTDDGLTWNSATTSEDNPYNDIVAKNGIVLLIGESGTNRIQRSTDLGQTYSNVTGFPSRFYTRGRVFKNKFVVMQSGAGSTDKLIVSDDGLTFTSAFPPPDSVVQFYGMEVIGDYLFIVGKGGAMYKTKDLSTFEAVDSGTTNDIYGICLTMINGFPVINTVSASGASDRITTSINLI